MLLLRWEQISNNMLRRAIAGGIKAGRVARVAQVVAMKTSAESGARGGWVRERERVVVRMAVMDVVVKVRRGAHRVVFEAPRSPTVEAAAVCIAARSPRRAVYGG